MSRQLEEIQAYLSPFRVTDEGDRYLVSAGTPKKQFFIHITKASLSVAVNKTNIYDNAEKQLTHAIERGIFTDRYKEVLNSDRRTKTYNDEIVMVDSLMPIGEKILVVHPETFTEMVDGLIYELGKKPKYNWKEIMENEK